MWYSYNPESMRMNTHQLQANRMKTVCKTGYLEKEKENGLGQIWLQSEFTNLLWVSGLRMRSLCNFMWKKRGKSQRSLSTVNNDELSDTVLSGAKVDPMFLQMGRVPLHVYFPPQTWFRSQDLLSRGNVCTTEGLQVTFPAFWDYIQPVFNMLQFT